MAMSRHYSQHARRALNHARVLAKKEHHPAIDSSHLLVGILYQNDSVGCSVLNELGMESRHVERVFRTLPRETQAETVVLEVTTGLRDALALANDEARWLGQNHVGTEHLLLGLARCNEMPMVNLLHALEITPEQIRRSVRRLLQDGITEISIEQAKRVARLSELSRRALNGAEQVADQMGHREVGLAHLLLVLARERRSVCAGLLHSAGLDDMELEANLTKPRPALGGVLDDVIDQAVTRAEGLGSHYTGTDHLLLALALDPRGARLMRKYHVDPQDIAGKLRAYFSKS